MGGYNVWKAVRKVMYRRTGSRYAFIGQSPFYRGRVTAADNDTALVFANDAQLDPGVPIPLNTIRIPLPARESGGAV